MNEGLDMSQYPSMLEIRRWGQSRKSGSSIVKSGRLPWAVIAAWDRAHPDRPFVNTQSFHGTWKGYSEGCRCIGCCESGRATSREYRRHGREDAAEDSP